MSLRNIRRYVGSLGRIVVLVVLGIWLLAGCDARQDEVVDVTEGAPKATPSGDFARETPTRAVPEATPTAPVPEVTPTAAVPEVTPTLQVPEATPTEEVEKEVQIVERPLPVTVERPGGAPFSECGGLGTVVPWGPRYDYEAVAWSPDGSTVYFTYGWDLYGVTADGSRLWLIATGALPDGHPRAGFSRPKPSFAVAPDGSYLVYASCRYPRAWFTRADGRRIQDSGGGRFELVRVTVDGGNVERLTTNGGVNHYPAWSPDGRRIAYVSDAERRARDTVAFLAGRATIWRLQADASASRVSLFTMAADGTDIRQVLDDEFAVLHHPPAWSPDGRHLAVVRYHQRVGYPGDIKQFGRQLYVVGAEGGEPRLLAENVVSGPSWSPDGQQLAIAQAEADGVGLYVMGIDGAESRRVIDIGGWAGPNWRRWADPAEAWIDTVAWSPDGTRILVRSNFNDPPLVVYVETGETMEVGSALDLLLGVWAAAWSPDGSRIAMIGGWESVPVRADGRHIVETVAADGSDAKVLVIRGPGSIPFAVGSQELDQAACADGTLVPDPAGSAGLVRDCQVLLELRESLFGESAPWSNWRPGTPMDQWPGVTITGTPPRVTSLSLRSQDLRGTLSPALGDLTSLRTLDLAFNSFSGSIPAKLGNLSQLRRLGLASNELRGPIPPALGRLTKLEVLSLSDNYLEGAIPPELGQLVNLRLLGLEANKLVGDIPPELGRLPKLEYVWLGGNDLTGCAPAELPVEDSASLGLPTCEPAA